jgi:23S rRNA pseudouridine1911/1915/1917 synthase
MIQAKVPKKDAGERLDIFVRKKLPEISRASVQKLCDQGRVTVNGEVQKAGYKLKQADIVKIDFDPKEIQTIPPIKLPILYEDSDCLVINKPIGVLTHSKGGFNPEGTVATFIKNKLSNLDGDRAGIVHRLDRATSGVIICAKHPEALRWLQRQFSQRKVKKTYLAVVSGHLNAPVAIIDMPIERNPKKPQTFRTSATGKPAITDYKVLKSGKYNDLVELNPKTGRTHQLRVHMKQLNHPILGDTLYGDNIANRLYLHAESLEITLPNHERHIFTTKTPRIFREVL